MRERRPPPPLLQASPHVQARYVVDCGVKILMPYRILCNGELLEGTKASPSLASKLSCYMPLHNNFYGITDVEPHKWFPVFLIISKQPFFHV